MPINGRPMPGRMPPEKPEDYAEVRGRQHGLESMQVPTMDSVEKTIALHKALSTKTLHFTYKNWKGEIGHREIIPLGFYFGSTEFHPGPPQVFLKGIDLNARKREIRDYAWADFLFTPVPVPESDDDNSD